MRNLLLLFLTALLTCCNFNNKREFYPAGNENFKYSGRYEHQEQDVALISSAASTQVKVYGENVEIKVASGNGPHHYLALELNGKYIGRYRVQERSINLELPANKEGNVLKLFKDTEAANGSILFNGIKAEKIEKLADEKKQKIEFIGNSITCGMGADTREINCEEGEWFDQHNAYLAYGPRVARALDVDFEVSCVSGMGMYRNWNDEDEPVMPDVYENLFLTGDTTKKADFSQQPPDVVSIALGTNDFSLGDGEKERAEFNKEKFIENYISFIETIYNIYPQTRIALLSSPMVGEKEGKLLVEYLKEISDHFPEREIAVFEFEKMDPGGCTSHPDIDDHKEIARMLIPFYKDLLN